MFRKLFFALAITAGLSPLLAMVGCGGGPEFVTRRNFVEFSPQQREQIQVENSRSYHIQTGDVLRVAFFYLKELNQDAVLVLPDGSVSLIGIDRAMLAGLTVLEADSLLTTAYSREYRSPNLSVIVMETKGKRIYVTGEVGNPGLYEISPGGLAVMNAITMANGFKESAAKDAVVLIRVTSEGYLCQEVNLNDFHKVKSNELGPISLDGYDIVYVPRSRSGDFAYFSRTFLGGVTSAMRIVTDYKYITTGARY